MGIHDVTVGSAERGRIGRGLMRRLLEVSVHCSIALQACLECECVSQLEAI